NFVAIKFVNKELEPFWGSSLRFIIASALLFGIVRLRGLPLPKGKALTGAALYGLFLFGINFGLLSWALLSIPAGVASVVFATIPLLTLLMASLIGLEKVTLRGMLGAGIVIVAIALIFREQLKLDVSPVFILAVFFAANFAALSGI